MAKVSKQTLDLIKNFEGFRDKAYQDSVGVWTIGYGTTKVNGVSVKSGDTITKEKAEWLLYQQVEDYQANVEKMVKAPINENQLSALVSFAYNLGSGALLHSSLLRFLNVKETVLAANEFMRWVYAGEVQLPGLVKRRQAERALFLKPLATK